MIKMKKMKVKMKKWGAYIAVKLFILHFETQNYWSNKGHFNAFFLIFTIKNLKNKKWKNEKKLTPILTGFFECKILFILRFLFIMVSTVINMRHISVFKYLYYRTLRFFIPLVLFILKHLLVFIHHCLPIKRSFVK